MSYHFIRYCIFKITTFVIIPMAWSQPTCPSHSLVTVPVQVGQTTFQVELAQTLVEHACGLMFRTQLAPQHGMLFIQPVPESAHFWMKNTFIALDMLFFDAKGQLVKWYRNVPPCTTTPCPTYSVDAPVKYILEINAGEADHYGLQLGDVLRISK